MRKKRVEEDKFYSDLDLWAQPVFTASNKSDNKNKVVEIEGRNNILPVRVEYGDRVPTWIDQKTIWVIEAIFGRRFNFNEVNEEFRLVYAKEKRKFLDEIKREPNEVDVQHLVYNAMEQVRMEYRMYIDISEIADILYPGQRATTALRRSLETLNNTFILAGSRFYFGQERAELYLERIPMIHLAMSSVGGSTTASVSLSPFHLYNLMMKKIIGADLAFILQIERPIAGLTYKYLHPRIYGARNYKNSIYSFAYEDLVLAIQVERFESRSRIITQIGPSFDELVRKRFIGNWSLSDSASGHEISVVVSDSFYEEFYMQLSEREREKIERMVWAMSPSKLEKMMSDYLSTSMEKDPVKCKKLAEYYVRYKLANQ